MASAEFVTYRTRSPQCLSNKPPNGSAQRNSGDAAREKSATVDFIYIFQSRPFSLLLWKFGNVAVLPYFAFVGSLFSPAFLCPFSSSSSSSFQALPTPSEEEGNWWVLSFDLRGLLLLLLWIHGQPTAGDGMGEEGRGATTAKGDSS